MPEPLKFSLNEAALPDGTIDFYTLIGEPADAPGDALRARIQALYAEAQANRDHRNLTRRREFQTVIELMPGARAALLDAEKRQRYDAYLAAARAGTNTPDFEDFMNDLMGLADTMEEKTDILGIQDKSPEPRVRVTKAPVAKATVRTAPAPQPKASAVNPLAVVGLVLGLLLGAALGHILLHNLKHHTIPTALMAIVVGAVVFVLLNRKPGQRVKR